MMRMRVKWMLVLAVVVGMVLGGGAALASHQFTDVPNSNPFHKEVDFVADRSITLGCGGGNYCPKGLVTREQMAAFLERTTRVATPVILAKWELVPPGAIAEQRCKTDSYVPDYPQQVIFNGGVSAPGDDDFAADTLRGLVMVSVNGGLWQAVDNARWMLDGNNDSEQDEMAVPLMGTLWLAPGTSYQFSVGVSNGGDAGECQLVAAIYNRMPSSIGLP